MKLTKTTLAAASLSLAMLVSACGGGGGGSSSVVPPVNPPVTPPGMVDAFLAIVAKLVSAVSDTTEPQATDAIQATTPETTEPAPL